MDSVTMERDELRPEAQEERRDTQPRSFLAPGNIGYTFGGGGMGLLARRFGMHATVSRRGRPHA